MTNTDLISEFVGPEIIEAVKKLIDASDSAAITENAVVVSSIFGSESNFKAVLAGGEEEQKLIPSFKKNLTLLIQKTWVEKTDEAVKEQVLYNLEQFCAYIEDGKYADEYARYGKILTDVVYLMFGSQSKEPAFEEYALRIDPEFGIFWWYILNLPENADFSNEKCRAIILLGMYFLSNY